MNSLYETKKMGFTTRVLPTHIEVRVLGMVSQSIPLRSIATISHGLSALTVETTSGGKVVLPVSRKKKAELEAAIYKAMENSSDTKRQER